MRSEAEVLSEMAIALFNGDKLQHNPCSSSKKNNATRMEAAVKTAFDMLSEIKVGIE